MLTKAFKEEALKKLEQMTAEDFIGVFKKIGSQKAEKEDNIYLAIEKDFEHYGISIEFSPYMTVKEHNIRMQCNNDYSKESLYVLAA